MTRDIISFPREAMVLPQEDLPEAARAAHAADVEARDEARVWAARIADACCGDQEVRELQHDPES